MRENRLRWFDHIKRRSRDTHVRRMEQIEVTQGKKLKERPKITWLEVIRKDIKLLELEEKMMVYRNDQRKRIHLWDQM